MNLPNTPPPESDSRRDEPRSALAMLRRVLVTMGGLFAFGVLGLLLAGTANAQTRAAPPAPPAQVLAPIGALLAPVTGTVGALAAPATAVLSPVIDPLARVAAPAVAPVVRPIATAISPLLSAIEPVIGPLATPVLASPSVAPVSAELGLHPATSALTVPSIHGPTVPVAARTQNLAVTPGTRSTNGVPNATRSSHGGTPVVSGPQGYGGETLLTSRADWPGSPWAPTDSLASGMAGTASAGPGGGSGAGHALPVGRSHVTDVDARWPIPATSWPDPQNWHGYGHNHPS